MATKTITDLAAAGALSGDELMEVSQASSSVAVTAATISALATDNSFNDSADGFGDFEVGDRVTVSGFATAANNLVAGVVTAAEVGKLTIGGTDGDVITDEAAGETVTIAKLTSRRATAQEIADLGGGGSAEYPSFTDNAGKVLAVNDTEDDVEWVEQSGGGGGGSGEAGVRSYYPPAAAKLWRISFPLDVVAYSGVGGNIGFAEVQFKDETDTLITPDGAYAGTQKDGNWPASELINGVTSGSTEGWQAGGSEARRTNAFVYLEFPSNVLPTSLDVWPPSSETTSFPDRFILSYSVDGAVWFPVGVFATDTPVSNTKQTFLLSAADTSGDVNAGIGAGTAVVSARYWRVRNLRANSTSDVAVGELRFRDGADANLATGGTPISSSDFDGTYTAAKAFDGVTTGDNGWYAQDGRRISEWVGYDFGSAVAPRSVEMFPYSSILGDNMRSLAVEYSDDGEVWQPLCFFEAAAWAAGVSQSFDLPGKLTGWGDSGSGGGGGETHESSLRVLNGYGSSSTSGYAAKGTRFTLQEDYVATELGFLFQPLPGATYVAGLYELNSSNEIVEVIEESGTLSDLGTAYRPFYYQLSEPRVLAAGTRFGVVLTRTDGTGGSAHNIRYASGTDHDYVDADRLYFPSARSIRTNARTSHAVTDAFSDDTATHAAFLHGYHAADGGPEVESFWGATA